MRLSAAVGSDCSRSMGSEAAGLVVPPAPWTAVPLAADFAAPPPVAARSAARNAAVASPEEPSPTR
ncbi:hypothetical protein amb4222 [Paramagnetospirillum magneticum AMB-1]|uniref:Uncharacterized protein n=1 Tax=Paramagnetospirillum magneticum (strain ATCC 700264 / AMB-1) TaxID=342108 RepID=Q2VZE9_PARM1|nr:hypothetical protein amb4222 [Paramagnetospirillum magneticum AMB-1]